MYYLDSCICIDLMRGKLPATYELMKNSDPSMFAVPAVVEAELRTGAYKSREPLQNEMLVERFLRPYEIVSFDSKCATAYAQIRSSLERSGRKIGGNDLLIAATCRANNAILVTSNINEFKRVQGLSIEFWDETLI